VLRKITPDLLFDMKQMGLSGASPLGEFKTKALNSDYHNRRDVPSVAARQAEGRAGLPQARG